MANLIDDTENAFVLVVVLGIGGLFLWYLLESKNFPDGGDPGTNPAAQWMQGIVESFRNFKDYVFGSSDDTPDPGSATTQEEQSALTNYQAPSAQQALQTYTAAPLALGSLMQTLANNPGSLPIF